MLALVTGNEAWGGLRENPSSLVANSLDGRKVNGFDVVGVELENDFYEIPKVTKSLLKTYKPDVVVSTGWDFTNKIKVEKVALNVIDSLYNGVHIPDSHGNRPRDETIIEGAPLAYRATLPVDDIVKELNRNGIPATHSYHACTHGCNEIMFSFLHHINSFKMQTISGFIHIMPTPEMLTDESTSENIRATAASMSLDLQIKAVELALEVATRSTGQLISNRARKR